MDPSLTFPAFFNVTLNPTLTYADLFPSILSIVVVIVGGFITYLSAIRIDEQKRQYELKKEVYFSVLNSIVEARQKWRKDIDDNKNLHLEDLEGPDPVIFKFMELKDFLALNQMKMQICASDEINRIFDSALVVGYYSGKECSFFDEILPQLIQAMKNDLMKSKKSWWQFWK